MRGVNWALLVGAVPRKAGMERSDLLRVNGGIFSEQGRAIDANAADDVRVFVVGNPANTNCLIAMNNAPRIPQSRFFAMTALDELRARAQLAKRAGVDTTEISQMVIWGNHSTTQYPDFANARISGRPAARRSIADRKWLEEHFIPTVQNRGAEVIKARGASSAASAANAAIVGVYNLTHDTLGGGTLLGRPLLGRRIRGRSGPHLFRFRRGPKTAYRGSSEGIDLDEFGRRKLRRNARGAAQGTRRGKRARIDTGAK